MSYVTMDHAGWLESNIAAAKRQTPSAQDRRNARQGKGWLAAPDKLSPDQARIFNILGIVGGGIYNAPISWGTVEWECGNGVSVVWRGGMSTFDFWRLSLLVFLCHDARIRCNIQPCAREYLRISLHPRSAEASNIYAGHPNIDEAIAAYRAYVPADHPIAFRAPVEELAA